MGGGGFTNKDSPIGMYKFSVWRTENRSTCRKTSCNKEDNQHIIMALMLGIERRPHQWQPSALTTASFLLPCTILAPQLYPCSPTPSLPHSTILAPLHHPCSPAPSLLHSSIPAPQLHLRSPAPSLLYCTILPLLLHPCSPTPSLPPFTFLLPCAPSTPCSPGPPCSEAIFKFLFF